MRAEIEVVLARVANVGVDHGAGRDVVALSYHVGAVLAEQTHVVSLLDTDERDSRSVATVGLQLAASGTNRLHLVRQHQLELTLANTVSVHDDLEFSLQKSCGVNYEDNRFVFELTRCGFCLFFV